VIRLLPAVISSCTLAGECTSAGFRKSLLQAALGLGLSDTYAAAFTAKSGSFQESRAQVTPNDS